MCVVYLPYPMFPRVPAAHNQKHAKKTVRVRMPDDR